MDRALLHSDCCYKVPHMRVRGHMCKTHQASNTAFRGFGGPQGLMFAEMWIEQVRDRESVCVCVCVCILKTGVLDLIRSGQERA